MPISYLLLDVLKRLKTWHVQSWSKHLIMLPTSLTLSIPHPNGQSRNPRLILTLTSFILPPPSISGFHPLDNLSYPFVSRPCHLDLGILLACLNFYEWLFTGLLDPTLTSSSIFFVLLSYFPPSTKSEHFITVQNASMAPSCLKVNT